MKIIEALKTDLIDILDLQKQCYTENAIRYNNFNITPLTQSAIEIEQEFEDSIFLKAIIDNYIIGSVRAYIQNEICYIGRLIVHPNHQNKGIGKALMHNLEKQFSKVKHYELFTGEKDNKNLALYNKLGYASYKQIEVDGIKLIYLTKKNHTIKTCKLF